MRISIRTIRMTITAVSVGCWLVANTGRVCILYFVFLIKTRIGVWSYRNVSQWMCVQRCDAEHLCVHCVRVVFIIGQSDHSLKSIQIHEIALTDVCLVLLFLLLVAVIVASNAYRI